MLGFGKKKTREAEKQKTGLAKGLSRTRAGLLGKLTQLFKSKNRIDAEVLDHLEELLIGADVGVDTTLKIVQGVEARAKAEGYTNTEEMHNLIKGVVLDLFSTESAESELQKLATQPEKGTPYVILVVGVNGVGKTTTVGKLAHYFQSQGKRVMLGAADTFRAAAVDQLTIWAERASVPMVKHAMGSDPAAVAYDTVEQAKSKNIDVVLIDTAGRLHNKVGLMNELGKIKRATGKVVPNAPHEVLLILDASTGQNAYEQARQFMQVTTITGLVLTKLDGTARGGVAIGISDQLQVPIKYVGVGEGIDDLRLFDKRGFVEELFETF